MSRISLATVAGASTEELIDALELAILHRHNSATVEDASRVQDLVDRIKEELVNRNELPFVVTT